MASIQVNLFSKSLMRVVPVHVLLPVDKLEEPGTPPRENKPYKTLYLLHGIFGNHMDWGMLARVQALSEAYDLAIVMPSGENAFYVDQPKSHNMYGEFIGKELVELTRKMFPLSDKKEDTFIGGLSMGGYGAMRNGLKYHETFGYIISLSGALVIDGMKNRTNDSPMYWENRDFAEAIFGDLECVEESDKNPKYLIEQLLAQAADIPKIYIACGEQDFLVEANKDFARFLQKKNVEAEVVWAEGIHDWNFWSHHIKKAVAWLPLENTGFGVGSGNVK